LFSACTDLRRSFSTTPSTTNNEDDEEEIVSTYSRISPLEHILLRPGMYIGPTERLLERCTVLDPESVHLFHPNNVETLTEKTTEIKMIPRMTQRHPALLKVFDEILVNASDNRLRSTTTKPNSRNSSTTTTKIDVTIDPGCIKSKRRPFISIRSNGQGIPIQIHDTEKLYIPEMVFGHLLTGSNFHDESKTKRLTGNGISLYYDYTFLLAVIIHLLCYLKLLKLSLICLSSLHAQVEGMVRLCIKLFIKLLIKEATCLYLVFVSFSLG